MTIQLEEHQQNAMKFAILTKFCLWFIKAGQGKTLSSLGLIRYLLKKKEIDKAIIACTISATSPFITDAEKLGVKLEIIETLEDFKEKLNSKKHRIILVKHSMINEIGLLEENIKYFRRYLTKNYQKLLLIVDEAHELNNYNSLVHAAYQNIFFMWDRVVAMTATPWSSSLLQILGMMCLVRSQRYYKNLYSSIKEFKNKYIIEEPIKNKKGKVIRWDTVEYVNVDKLRKEVESFTFFYYPEINLEFQEFKIKLEDYIEYDNLIEESLNKEPKQKKDGKNKSKISKSS